MPSLAKRARMVINEKVPNVYAKGFLSAVAHTEEAAAVSSGSEDEVVSPTRRATLARKTAATTVKDASSSIHQCLHSSRKSDRLLHMEYKAKGPSTSSS